MIYVDPKEDNLKFSCWYHNWKCVKKGGSRRGYLEDIEGSWAKTWMTGLFLTSWIMFFYPKEDTLKISCWYLNGKCVKKEVLGGHWGFLTGDMDDRIIIDIMNDAILPQGRYPENFMLISLLEVRQEGGVKKGVTWRTLRVPDRRLRGQGHPWQHGWSW